MDPILIDECLSPHLAAVAQARGLSAMHVTWLNMEGAEDWDVAALAAERDYVVVTNNRRDFLRLYAELEVHNGLIIIVPAVLRAAQRRLFEIALDTAERQDSLINLLIEVHADGSVDVSDWSTLEGKDRPGGR
jgi:predicted nuclease of predicted toxin-antitoxin system